MFDLNENIAGWRRQMLAAGIKDPVPLEELECHLRDEVEDQRLAGLGEEQAFHAAVRQLGGAGTLKSEFKKAQPTTIRKQMIKTLLILAALFGSVLGGAMVLPALGRWHHSGILIVWPLMMGGIMALIAGGAALYGVRHHRGERGRRLIGAGIILAGCFYIVPLLQAFFRTDVDVAGWIVCALLAAASVAFYGTCFRLNRSSMPN